jgi:D-sedoheptulose 7-phosphate isomerase
LCQHEIIVPSGNTARIQEVHTLVLHQWLEAIDATPWPVILP